MTTIGFRYFDNPAQAVSRTMKQQVGDLTPELRQLVYDAFAAGKHPNIVKHQLSISQDLIEYIYEGISNMQIRCAQVMRREIIITPAVLNAQGVIITPAVMNVAPATIGDLKTAITAEFSEDFPGTAINNIINTMVNWSRYDGSGNFSFYATNVKL